MEKIRVAILYGGRSGEHEVSLQSAASVINHLDRDRFEIVPVAINKQGRWHLNDISLLEGKKSLPVFKDAPKVCASAESPRHEQWQRIDRPGWKRTTANNRRGLSRHARASLRRWDDSRIARAC